LYESALYESVQLLVTKQRLVGPRHVITSIVLFEGKEEGVLFARGNEYIYNHDSFVISKRVKHQHIGSSPIVNGSLIAKSAHSGT
jgi:hypothetical protein